ncbi:cupin fold metalloprotein, WbuC family [Escherichia coli]|uniref:WbuC family cupin fold metalloprotein n=1 Tax=Escherichia coli TaxID=562 RepID=UPI00101F1B7E|nr:WbuC family cupin fold metalloprotein [Escherichia coli]RYL72506.1 cupin fold metalloprotein, WbuC family [Escherichia coli]RYL74905.1 cupin fold metalloprotein, WbuC family [Escherichia coli]
MSVTDAATALGITRTALSRILNEKAGISADMALRLESALGTSCQRRMKSDPPGTYVRPHRHPHTFELLLPLRGRFVVLNFDDRGTVTHRAILGETCTVLEMAAGTWHAVLSLDTGGIIFEVKHGGYQPVAADDYAHWAPAEGEPGTTELMAWYAQAQVGDSTFAV